MADKSKMIAEFNRKFAEIKGKFEKNSSITEADIIELDSILPEVTLSTEQDHEFIDELTDLIVAMGRENAREIEARNAKLDISPEETKKEADKVLQKYYKYAYFILNTCAKKFKFSYFKFCSIKSVFVRVEALKDGVVIDLKRKNNDVLSSYAPDSLESIKHSLSMNEQYLEETLSMPEYEEIRLRSEWIMSEIKKSIEFLERKYQLKNPVVLEENGKGKKTAVVEEVPLIEGGESGSGVPSNATIEEAGTNNVPPTVTGERRKKKKNKKNG